MISMRNSLNALSFPSIDFRDKKKILLDLSPQISYITGHPRFQLHRQLPCDEDITSETSYADFTCYTSSPFIKYDSNSAQSIRSKAQLGERNRRRRGSSWNERDFCADNSLLIMGSSGFRPFLDYTEELNVRSIISRPPLTLYSLHALLRITDWTNRKSHPRVRNALFQVSLGFAFGFITD